MVSYLNNPKMAQAYIDHAVEDITAARILLKESESYEQSCFLVQRSCENMLKSVIIIKGEPLTYAHEHKMEELLNDTQLELPEEIANKIVELGKYSSSRPRMTNKTTDHEITEDEAIGAYRHTVIAVDQISRGIKELAKNNGISMILPISKDRGMER
jgi:HEPN domain-containing protein